MASRFDIPAPETDFLDPRTGKISTLWYQYLFALNKTTVETINTITYGPGSWAFSNHTDTMGEQGEQGPRGLPGRNGRDGVTKIVHVYLPADENEPMTVYRKR